MAEKLEYPFYWFVVIGATLGVYSFATADVGVFYECWEHPDELNSSEWMSDDKEFVQLSGETERWRTWIGMVRYDGAIEYFSDRKGEKEVDWYHGPSKPSFLAEFYGDGKYTNRFECERGSL